MSDHFITHVSDTARWTALHRATESARPDALFHDPLAERLAGTQGHAIVAKVPRTTRNGWWLIARTKIIDDAILKAIEDVPGPTEWVDDVFTPASNADLSPGAISPDARVSSQEA